MRQLDLEYAGTQLVLLCWMPAKVYVAPICAGCAAMEAPDPALSLPVARYKMTAWRKRACGEIAAAHLGRAALARGRATQSLSRLLSAIVYTQSTHASALPEYAAETKNQWARDDPAFLVLLLALLAVRDALFPLITPLPLLSVHLTRRRARFAQVSAVAHAIAFHRFSLTGVLFLLLVAWAELVVAGIAIASVCWWVANARLRVHHSHSVEQRVEWLYAFDVHCNGFVPFFLLTHVAQVRAGPRGCLSLRPHSPSPSHQPLTCTQYTLLPLLLRPGFTGTLFSTLVRATSPFAAGPPCAAVASPPARRSSLRSLLLSCTRPASAPTTTSASRDTCVRAAAGSCCPVSCRDAPSPVRCPSAQTFPFCATRRCS